MAKSKQNKAEKKNQNKAKTKARQVEEQQLTRRCLGPLYSHWAWSRRQTLSRLPHRNCNNYGQSWRRSGANENQ